jgi:hypothetical protein
LHEMAVGNERANLGEQVNVVAREHPVDKTGP